MGGQGFQFNVMDPGKPKPILGGELQPQGTNMGSLFQMLTQPFPGQGSPPPQAPAVGLRQAMTPTMAPTPSPMAGTVPGGLSTFSATPPVAGIPADVWAKKARFFA